MAVIGKIREQSTLVLIIIGGAIIAFILTDLFSAKAGGGQGPINLAEINGESISPQEFDERVNQAYDNYTQRTQQELDERTKSSLRESVWNEIMADKLLGNEMEKLGVQVTTKELFDMVQGENPHPQVLQAFTDPNTGQFNRDQVVRFLQDLDANETQKTQWVEFERALKRNRRMEKYNNLIKEGLYTPSALATMQAKENSGAIAMKYIYKPYTSIVDSTISLSESDIEAYYNEHKEEYEQKASRKIAYAYLPVVPSDKDQADAKLWVENTAEKFKEAKNDSTFVNANSDARFDPTYYSQKYGPAGVDTLLWNQEVGYVAEPKLVGDVWSIYKVKSTKVAPDSVRARHILISTQTRPEETAKQTADSVLNLLQGGATIESLISLSEDPVSAENGGDLNWFAEGGMIKPISDTAFAANVGEFKITQSQFGYHIIEVTDKTDDVKKIQIATITRAIEPSRETFEELFNKANSFSINVKDMESFKAEITAQNLQQRSAVLASEDNTIQGLTSSRDLTRWVKEANEGDVSEAKDVGDAFAVAIVESVDEEGISPLDKVRNRIEYLARVDKKAEVLKKEMEGGASIGELAGNTGLSVENANLTFASPAIPAVGLEPTVVGVASSLAEGEMSEPIQGANGVFVIQIDKKTDPNQVDIAQVRTSYANGVNARVDNGAVLTAIKEKSNLTDNRSKFY